MPPKKTASASRNQAQAEKPEDKNSNAPTDQSKDQSKSDSKAASAIPSKRKADVKDTPAKAPRRSARGVSSVQPDPVGLMQYLLSAESLDPCRPKDEIGHVQKHGSKLRTYSSSTFTPFEELICAVILSRPISHALGLRSIRTIFNDPYDFTTPKKIRDAGFEPVRKALDEARTQHRQKTAEELVMLADAAVNHFGDNEDDVNMEKVRRECGNEWSKEKEMLKTHVKGLGKTGLDIFARRIQALWPECYPFADQRTLSGLQKLGLPGTAEELQKQLDQHSNELDLTMFPGNDEEKKRRAFVQILERAVGVDLEGNADKVRADATPKSE
ncbi:MAG: hypothetical protein Q9174_004658 [Haloplaca sp. 1 TL-2023]